MCSGKACFYKALQVSRQSTDKQIRESFLRLAKLYHPDINKERGAIEEFRHIHEAYTALKDAQARSMYELTLLEKKAVHQPYYTSRPAHDTTYDARKYDHTGYSPPTGFTNSSTPLIFPLGVFLLVSLFVCGYSFGKSPSPNSQYPISTSSYRERCDKVDAWWNPSSSRWETPAPWDPLYIKNKSSLRQMDRKVVFRRK